MQFGTTESSLKISGMLYLYFICYFFFIQKTKLTNFFTINTVSFQSFIFPTLICCGIADATAFNITQSGRYHAFY